MLQLLRTLTANLAQVRCIACTALSFSIFTYSMMTQSSTAVAALHSTAIQLPSVQAGTLAPSTASAWQQQKS